MLDAIPPRMNSGRTKAAKPAITQSAMTTNRATAQPGNGWRAPGAGGGAWPGGTADGCGAGCCAAGGGATACGAPHAAQNRPSPVSGRPHDEQYLSLIHISEPTRLGMISY